MVWHKGVCRISYFYLILCMYMSKQDRAVKGYRQWVELKASAEVLMGYRLPHRSPVPTAWCMVPQVSASALVKS